MGKIESYLGFALRKKSVVKGFNAISYEKGKARLLILCESASENAVKEAKNLSKRLNVPLLISKKPLEELVHKENCKLIAITDRDLARAISEHTDENFAFVREDTENQYGRE